VRYFTLSFFLFAYNTPNLDIKFIFTEKENVWSLRQAVKVPMADDTAKKAAGMGYADGDRLHLAVGIGRGRHRLEY
jgi:hypothetical protein